MTFVTEILLSAPTERNTQIARPQILLNVKYKECFCVSTCSFKGQAKT